MNFPLKVASLDLIFFLIFYLDSYIYVIPCIAIYCILHVLLHIYCKATCREKHVCSWYKVIHNRAYYEGINLALTCFLFFAKGTTAAQWWQTCSISCLFYDVKE